MKKQPKTYKGNLKQLWENTIYINVDHLGKGGYIIHIVHKNKTLRKVTFKL